MKEVPIQKASRLSKETEFNLHSRISRISGTLIPESRLRYTGYGYAWDGIHVEYDYMTL